LPPPTAQADAERYRSEHCPMVTELLKPVLEFPPRVPTFDVGASTFHPISKGQAA
jgi:hypothetical protein